MTGACLGSCCSEAGRTWAKPCAGLPGSSGSRGALQASRRACSTGARSAADHDGAESSGRHASTPAGASPTRSAAHAAARRPRKSSPGRRTRVRRVRSPARQSSGGCVAQFGPGGERPAGRALGIPAEAPAQLPGPAPSLRCPHPASSDPARVEGPEKREAAPSRIAPGRTTVRGARPMQLLLLLPGHPIQQGQARQQRDTKTHAVLRTLAPTERALATPRPAPLAPSSPQGARDAGWCPGAIQKRKQPTPMQTARTPGAFAWSPGTNRIPHARPSRSLRAGPRARRRECPSVRSRT
jgi:hypothetical protein